MVNHSFEVTLCNSAQSKRGWEFNSDISGIKLPPPHTIKILKVDLSQEMSSQLQSGFIQVQAVAQSLFVMVWGYQ